MVLVPLPISQLCDNKELGMGRFEGKEDRRQSSRVVLIETHFGGVMKD